MIFSGVQHAVCRNAGGSASSIVPITRKCSSFACIRRFFRSQQLPDELPDAETIWKDRYRSIVDLEEHLHRNGTRIIKFFLHLSKDEQAKRFRDRIDEPEKNWKFGASDVHERKSWPLYMQAYEACMSGTSTANAPWYVVPADDKKNARLIISQIILDTFDELKMAYPKTTRKAAPGIGVHSQTALRAKAMTHRQPQTPLYPLRFEPIYQYRLWGGRRLADLLTAPLPGDGPVGEAWVLSDRDDHPSKVADGPLKGRTLAQLLEQFPEQLMGNLAGRFRRFPLLLKFLDAREMLSVQVHPADTHTDLLPAGETGKTEAWVVLEAGPQSRIYAGLKPATTAEDLRRALANGAVADDLV